MAVGPAEIAATYPIPTYRFIVTVGDDAMAFSSASGLDIAFDTIEYKDGVGGYYKMPGQRKASAITLSRGIMKGGSVLYAWISSISLNRVEKRNISISLTNETGSELFVTWNVANAFPTALGGPSLDASSNQVAIEQLSLMADYVSVQFH